MVMHDGPPVPLRFARPGAAPKARTAALAALRNRNFRWYWFGLLGSFNAMQMEIVVRGWLVYTMTNSALALGEVSAGFGVPMLLFSLFGGATADRVRKRNLLLFTRTGMTLVSLAITLLITLDRIAVWHLMVASVLSGSFMSFDMPSRQAFVRELVGKDALLNAIAMNSMAMNICRIASPAVAGVLLKVIGVKGAYWLIAFSSMGIIFSLFMIPPGSPMRVRSHAPMMRDVVEGLRYVRQSTVLLMLLVVGLFPVVTAMPYQTLMPVFAKTVFNAGETGLGLLMSAVGVGALTGSTLIVSLGDFRRKGRLEILAGLLFGGALVMFGLAGSLLQAMGFLLFLGAGSSMFMTLNSTLIMSHTPEELTGRVMSIYMMGFGLMPFASLPAGALAQAIGAPLTVILGGGILFLFLTGVALFQPRLRRLG
jgi:MFS family permease